MWKMCIYIFCVNLWERKPGSKYGTLGLYSSHYDTAITEHHLLFSTIIHSNCRIFTFHSLYKIISLNQKSKQDFRNLIGWPKTKLWWETSINHQQYKDYEKYNYERKRMEHNHPLPSSMTKNVFPFIFLFPNFFIAFLFFFSITVIHYFFCFWPRSPKWFCVLSCIYRHKRKIICFAQWCYYHLIQTQDWKF